jgi:uncharacterized membrane-anchored protein
VAEPTRRASEPGSQPGWREVVLVAAGAAIVVLGAAFVTGLLPATIQDAIRRTPVAIAALALGTGWLLWRISRRDPGAPSR